MIGNKILNGKYKILECLSKGRNGEIYKAYNPRLNQFVIVKTNNNILRDESSERYLYSGLKHPGLPTLYDVFYEDQRECMVMEYIKGTTLREVVDKGYILEKKAIQYAIKLCDVVDYLHSRSIAIIHGDIKPDNIIVRENETICLLDLNVSQRLNQSVSRYGYSKDFCSPEQRSLFNLYERMELKENNYNDYSSNKSLEIACGKGNDNHRSRIDIGWDIYAIGATIYYMLTGQSVNVASVEKTENISKELKNIVFKATKSLKSERYENVKQLSGELINLFIKKHKIL